MKRTIKLYEMILKMKDNTLHNYVSENVKPIKDKEFFLISRPRFLGKNYRLEAEILNSYYVDLSLYYKKLGIFKIRIGYELFNKDAWGLTKEWKFSLSIDSAGENYFWGFKKGEGFNVFEHEDFVNSLIFNYLFIAKASFQFGDSWRSKTNWAEEYIKDVKESKKND